MHRDSLCSGCGQALAETVGEENFDRWNASMVTCDACRAISRQAHIAAGKDDLDPMAGARFSVWPDAAKSNGSSPAPPAHQL